MTARLSAGELYQQAKFLYISHILKLIIKTMAITYDYPDTDTKIATVESDADVVPTKLDLPGSLRYYPTSFTGLGSLETSDNGTDWQAVTASANERIDPIDVIARFVRLTEAGTITMRNL